MCAIADVRTLTKENLALPKAPNSDGALLTADASVLSHSRSVTHSKHSAAHRALVFVKLLQLHVLQIMHGTELYAHVSSVLIADLHLNFSLKNNITIDSSAKLINGR